MENLKRGDLCKVTWENERGIFNSEGIDTHERFLLKRDMIIEAIRWHPEVASRYWLFWVPEANVFATLANDGCWFVKL